jgi:CoA:oxalate CoA-transferase
MSAGPFAGVLVVDLTRVLAGPYCTMMLAELGARVIKVENPDGGDDSRRFSPFHGQRSAYFLSLNRGKESVALDLKCDKDHALFLNMIRRADVLVENFRPGTLERLSLGYGRLKELNPRLIYASVSGFGHCDHRQLDTIWLLTPRPWCVEIVVLPGRRALPVSKIPVSFPTSPAGKGSLTKYTERTEGLTNCGSRVTWCVDQNVPSYMPSLIAFQVGS